MEEGSTIADLMRLALITSARGSGVGMNTGLITVAFTRQGRW
jgi:hypothetical protein